MQPANIRNFCLINNLNNKVVVKIVDLRFCQMFQHLFTAKTSNHVQTVNYSILFLLYVLMCFN